MSAAARRSRSENIIVHVPDVETTNVCSSLVEKLLEYVLVNKKIVPYPVSYLVKICGKPHYENCSISERDRVHEEIHIRKAQTFYKRLIDISQCLQKELVGDNWKKVRMIAFILGPTINCPKETYLLKIPDSFYDRSIENEKFDSMRYVVLNQDMSTFMSKYIAPTNVYIMVLKPEGDNSSWALPVPSYKITRRSSVAVVHLPRNKIKLKDYKADARPSCAEVEELIEDLCKLKLRPHNPNTEQLSLQQPERHSMLSKQNFSVEVQRNSVNAIHKLSTSSQTSGVFETNNMIDSERSASSSDSGSDGNYICSSVSTEEHFSVDTMCDRNQPNGESCSEFDQDKFIWYLYTECLSSFKEPVKRKTKGYR